GLITGEGESVPSAEVALYDAAGNQVNTAGYGQANPQTAAGGAYGWIVPNGSYYLTISSVGFYDRTTPLFTVSNHIVNRSVNLILAPPLLTDIIDPDAPLLDNALTIAKNLRLKAQSSVKRALQTLTDLADNPTVEKTTREVVVPTVVTAAAFGTLALVPWWDIISLLRLLFLQPLLLLGRGRRRGWGQVYNALNKLPIDLATLRLIDKETGKVVQTKVTDKEGRYAFVAPPGAYTIAVNKAGMLFPSALLGAITADGRRPDIYHGETIRVNDESAVITANIPLDPSGEHKRPSRLFWYQVGRAARLTFSWIGIIITAVSLYIAPVWYVWVLFGLHICLFFVFRRLAIPPKIKSWGIVYDAASKEPVRQAVARLFNLQFNKLVATQITDRKGRYYFLAGDDAYYVSYDHNNYAPTKSTTIDLKGKEAETITLDVGLNKPNNKRASLDAGATLNKNKLPPEKNFGVKTRF
ncbi:MAG TPA: carboxypeptidase-like regulatory domain-containing protein, partial [Patescibacteria group bacterium]|nr:carboxypeptidase-like regulatory domain-containing protein [Patescibacteria group bacterium]